MEEYAKFIISHKLVKTWTTNDFITFEYYVLID